MLGTVRGLGLGDGEGGVDAADLMGDDRADRNDQRPHDDFAPRPQSPTSRRRAADIPLRGRGRALSGLASIEGKIASMTMS